MIDNNTIILKLNPSVVTIRGDEAFDVNGDKVNYDKAAVQAYMDTNEYKSKRAAEYPSITDQLDALWKEIGGAHV
jgi:hypothetical protein